MAEKILERVYTIPLRKNVLKQNRVQRANRAVSTIQEFLYRHMKATDVKVSQKINEEIWKHGIHSPPSKIKVKARRDDKGVVTARLTDEVEEKPKEAQKKGRLDELKEKAGLPVQPKHEPKPKKEKAEEKKEEAPKEKPAEKKEEKK